jgi:lambda family phage portal protein
MGRLRDTFAVLTGRASASWRWNSGVSSPPKYDGAKVRGGLRSLYPSGLELDHDALRARSRAAYWDSTQARALLSRIGDNTIGTGLVLESTPIWDLIGSTMTPKQKRDWERKLELRFWIWANSHEPDAKGLRTLAELQAFAFSNELRDGETIAILRYSGDTKRTSPLSIQFIDPDQLGSAFDLTAEHQAAVKARGNLYQDGIELSHSGEYVAIWLTDPETLKTSRVPMFGPSGRRFVVMPQILDLPGQVRGTSPLAPLIHEIQKLTDYTVAEIEAAVINAIFAAYIKPGENNDTRTDLGKLVGGGVKQRNQASSADTTADTGQSVRINQPGMIVGNLKAGEELSSFDTKRPNVNFDAFVRSVTRYLSASISVPVEVLEMSFNVNYSASRAALIQFWMTIDRWRLHFRSQFLQPIYEAWFREEIKARRITAPGFDGADPVVTRAWLAAEWIGQSMPSIDPLKDANADDVRIAQCATTREKVAQKHNGSDFYENAARQAREREVLPQPEPQPDRRRMPREEDEE